MFSFISFSLIRSPAAHFSFSLFLASSSYSPAVQQLSQPIFSPSTYPSFSDNPPSPVPHTSKTSPPSWKREQHSPRVDADVGRPARLREPPRPSLSAALHKHVQARARGCRDARRRHDDAVLEEMHQEVHPPSAGTASDIHRQLEPPQSSAA